MNSDVSNQPVANATSSFIHSTTTAQQYDEIMEARYEAFLKASGLTRDFGKDPESDSSSSSSDSGCSPEEFNKFFKKSMLEDLSSDESLSESDSVFDDPAATSVAPLNVVKQKVVHKLSKQKNSKVTSYKCYKCKLPIEDRLNYIQHLLISHGKSFLCKYKKCRKQFLHPQSLAKHLKTHTDKSRPFVCLVCSVRFSSNSTLKRHITVNHSVKTNNNQSQDQPHCSKDYDSKLNLEVLTKKVSDNKHKYECNVCAKSYHRNSRLKEHYSLKHPTSEFRIEFLNGLKGKLSCPICQKKFRSQSEIQSHINTHPESQLRNLVNVSTKVILERLEIDSPIEISDSSDR